MPEFQHQKEFLDKLQKDWVKKLNTVGILLTNEIKKELGVVVDKQGVVRSAPGEPPRLETGELRRSIAFEVDAESLKVRAGTNKRYSGFLERGTKFMEPRPYIKPVAEANAGVVNLIMSKPMS